MLEEMQRKLTERVSKFMVQNRIECEETIYQCDWVLENSLEFIEDLYNILNEQYKKD